MSRSHDLFARASELMPGGVNSPVRAFRAVGGTPLFFERAKGARIWDADGKEYLDYVCSWGAILHGHADEGINQAIFDAAARGTSFGAPHAGEIRLAETVIERVPHLERVRFVNSGTEAALAVLRLVRASTGRPKVIKFAGNYHGAVDSLLAKAGSGIATFGLPDGAGIGRETTANTLIARYNNVSDVVHLLDAHRDEVAAILVEPVAGNMGCVPPDDDFLSHLRIFCDATGTLLVLDEVMTGFRVARGGATERYGVRPDLVMMGKVIGGGLPVGAYGGRSDLMGWVAPEGPMYQAGTLSGNPLAMAAGYAALSRLDDSAYERLETLGRRLQLGLESLASPVPFRVQRVGSMISMFFARDAVRDFDAAQASDKAFFGRLFHALLRRGIYLPPSALEAWFFSLAHTEADIEETVNAVGASLRELASSA